jgi:FkbM family methyltransferase
MSFEYVTLEDGHRIFISSSVVKSRIFDYLKRNGNYYELETLRECSNFIREGDGIIDVGANIGNHSVYFATKFGANVYAFESNSNLIVGLNKTISQAKLSDKIKVIDIAISDNSKNYLNVPSENDRAGQIVDNISHPELINKKIITQSLDEYFDLCECPINNLALIRIDTYGHEQQVLNSAKHLINRFRPTLVIELDHGQKFFDLYKKLSNMNYYLVNVANDTQTGIFIHQSKISNDIQKSYGSLFRKNEILQFNMTNLMRAHTNILSILSDEIINKLVIVEKKPYTISNLSKFLQSLEKKIISKLKQIIR